MKPKRFTASGSQPQTRNQLLAWVREHCPLPAHLEAELLDAIEAVFTRHEKLWQESKREAIQALSTGFCDKLARVRTELSAKDATIGSISHYFEALVADLTDQSHRDPKTRLMNFDHFSEQLESFLALEQRGRWCAIGLVDITGFKWYNSATRSATESSSASHICCESRYVPTTSSPGSDSAPVRMSCMRGSAATSSVS
jgi:hypothetical protein